MNNARDRHDGITANLPFLSSSRISTETAALTLLSSTMVAITAIIAKVMKRVRLDPIWKIVKVISRDRAKKSARQFIYLIVKLFNEIAKEYFRMCTRICISNSLLIRILSDSEMKFLTRNVVDLVKLQKIKA